LLFSSVISGAGIVFEAPHKRSEVTYYCLPKAIEAVWNSLERRRIIKSLPGQHIITFAICMGIIGMCFGDGTAPKTLKGVTLGACRTLWDEKIKSMPKVKATTQDEC